MSIDLNTNNIYICHIKNKKNKKNNYIIIYVAHIMVLGA